MKLLIAGDSFAAKYPGEFPGWADLLEDHYVVENIAQCGVGEYKILKQIESVNLQDYDVVIISHTSPYRIHTAMNPLHTNGIHNSCDFIYEDVRGRLPDVEKFFTEYFDLEYATRIYGLLHKEIDKILKNSFVIDTKLLGIEKLFKTNRGTVQHLDKAGNQKFFLKLQKILDKLEIISLRLDKVELQQKELLNKFATHIDFINETYEGLKNPLNAAKSLLGRK